MFQPVQSRLLRLCLLTLSLSSLSLSRPQNSDLLDKRVGTHEDPTQKAPPIFFLQLTDFPACSGPGSDDMSNPSQDCLNTQSLSTQGATYLTRSCNALSRDQRNVLNTAILDMNVLSASARASMDYNQCSYEHGCTPPPRAEQAMRYYMGDDSVNNLDYRGVIYRNIDRLSHFISNRPHDATRIYVHCDDPKNWCARGVEGKQIGGYAWTVSHWYWWWDYHINMCAPFYGQQNVGEALELVHGPTDGKDTASKLAYLQTTGSLLIHEFMHTAYISNSPPDPWIEDVDLNNGGGDKHRTYGPKDVWKLAHKRREDGGQGKLSRTNSDSYVQLVNSLYWWNQTNIFPGVPGRLPGLTTYTPDQESAADNIGEPPTLQLVYLGDITGTQESDEDLFNNAIAANAIPIPGAAPA